MTESLRQRLLTIDSLKPYVWRLRLTEDEYRQLGAYVMANTKAINREYAILAIIYIAEWYKREYDGNVSNPLGNVSAESLWKASGFDTTTYVYKAKKTYRHLESIFMLGGLPMSYILQRKDTKLLKALCRIYKGDKSSLEDDKDLGKGQAVAFQESIRQYASLYLFLKTLLLSDASEVYANEDLAKKSSLANQFIEAVKSAYDEVMRDKFRLEWIIDYDSSSPYMRRMLRLWLRPEEMGGLHQYLRFERAGSWGFPTLMQQRVLRVSLLFMNGKEVVGNDDTRRTIITFENSGQDDTGFEATGSVPWAILRTMPTVPFDRINVIITDDAGKTYEVQHFDCKQQYLQLWAMQNEMNRWSSTRNNQSETAVVYSDYYELTGEEHTTKPFYDKTNGITEPWNFAFITDHVHLKHGNDEPITLWNRDGYIQFAPRLYTNVLRYKAGRVRYMYNEDPEIYPEPETEEWYPAIFQRSDIKAYHFTSRDTVNTLPDILDIQKIEFKPFNAPNTEEYQEWTDDNVPEYGRLKLRLTIKDDEKIYPILYLPSMLEHGGDVPVLRDFENCQLHYVDDTNHVVQANVDIPMDKEPLDITMPLRIWGNEEEFVELDAILPTLIKEVYFDGRITKYLKDGEQFVLPYLLRNRISIHDFNKDGYSEYECFNVGVLNEKGSTQKWKQDYRLITQDVAATIPQYIRLAYGIPKNNGNVSKMLYWDYSSEKTPEEVDAAFSEMGNYSILFQDMRNVNENLDCVPPTNRNEWTLSDDDWDSDWDMDDEPKEEEGKQEVTLLRCYDIATMYKTYYFIFNPLYNITDETFISGICIPLKERQNNSLTEEDMQNLMRCATECGLNWAELSTKI